MTNQRSAFLYLLTHNNTDNPALIKHLVRLIQLPENEEELIRIKTKAHPQIRWLEPEKRNYKKQELETLLAETKQQQLKPLVFVVTRADLLQEQAANSLLKVLEEPPHNVFFVLTTANIHQVLPTIRSRLLVYTPEQDINREEEHPLIKLFSTLPLAPFQTLQEVLNKKDLDDIQSTYLLDTLVAHWHEAEKKNQVYAKQVLKILLFFAQKPPMPGSSKLFWRTIYLSIQTSTQR